MYVAYIEQDEAKQYIAQHHRHSSVPTGAIICFALQDENETEEYQKWIKEKKCFEWRQRDKVHGVAVLGRPISRRTQDKGGIEITRVCTDGTPNGCSMLYAKCIQQAKVMGRYKTVYTYLLMSETGASVKAAGFELVGINRGTNKTEWNRNDRKAKRKVEKPIAPAEFKSCWAYSLEEKPKKKNQLEDKLTRRQTSALTWLRIQRQAIFDGADDFFFSANAGHEALMCLLPSDEYGMEGIINEKLAEVGLPLIEFSVSADDILKEIPNAENYEWMKEKADFDYAYNKVIRMVEYIYIDITQYLTILDGIYKTAFADRLN